MVQSAVDQMQVDAGDGMGAVSFLIGSHLSKWCSQM